MDPVINGENGDKPWDVGFETTRKFTAVFCGLILPCADWTPILAGRVLFKFQQHQFLFR
jgi:hypothetical protein